jgi:hypothetical protein
MISAAFVIPTNLSVATAQESTEVYTRDSSKNYEYFSNLSDYEVYEELCIENGLTPPSEEDFNNGEIAENSEDVKIAGNISGERYNFFDYNNVLEPLGSIKGEPIFSLALSDDDDIPSIVSGIKTSDDETREALGFAKSVPGVSDGVTSIEGNEDNGFVGTLVIPSFDPDCAITWTWYVGKDENFTYHSVSYKEGYNILELRIEAQTQYSYYDDDFDTTVNASKDDFDATNNPFFYYRVWLTLNNCGLIINSQNENAYVDYSGFSIYAGGALPEEIVAPTEVETESEYSTEAPTEKPTAYEIISETGKIEILYGDVNSDEVTDVADVILINKYIVQSASINDYQKLCADVYSDGTIDSQDAMTLLKYLVNSIDSLPVTPKAE